MTAAILAAILAIHPLAHRAPIRTLDSGGGFSVDLPVVGRVQGATTTFFTSLDISNNTAQSTEVDFAYTPADGSAVRSGVLGTLNGFDNLHIDDFLGSLESSGMITANQAANSFGTLLLTFTNPAFHAGTEASAVARVYSNAPNGGTYGLAYRAVPMQTNGSHSLTTIIRNANGVVSNIGIENVGIDDSGANSGNVTVQVSFYDPATGTAVGSPQTYTLAPGQVMQLNNVFSQFGLTQSTLMVFVDEVGGTGQIRGYAVLKDAATNDGSFVFMQESKSTTF
jgi:hypothetical protein